MTILRPLARLPMAKQFHVAANGQVVKRDYPNAARFRVERVVVKNISDLHRVLRRIETDQTACIIRGEPNEHTNLDDTPRRKAVNGGTFDDVPRSWVMLDLDKVTLPAGMSVIADPQDVAASLVDLMAATVPELEGVTAIVQFSASAGLDEQAEAESAAGLPPRWGGVVKPGSGVGAHVWYWLAEAVDGEGLDRWAAVINARAGHKFIDPATLRTVQPHFTAGPVFEAGLRDPLAGRRTLLVRGDTDAAALAVPEVAPQRPFVPKESGSTGQGYQERLAAIGGPDGFHGPINGAIASFIGSNGPRTDIEALKAALAERILAADPGGRSPSEIARYASDDGLHARIAWVLKREQEKRNTLAAEAAAAKAIDPTFPDRGVPLAEATRLTVAAIAGFATRIAEGQLPRLLLKKSVGGGKTAITTDELPRLLAAGKAVGRGPGLFLHPRHTLGDQIAADIRIRHPGLAVAVWRGLEAEDPAKPGRKMCRDPELPRAARAAGQSATAGCPACPLAPGCAYLAQASAGRDADVWVAPHQTLFASPFAGWPRVTTEGGKTVPALASFVIADEDLTGAGLRGLDALHPIQIALSAFGSDETPNLTGKDRDRLLGYRQRALDALTGQPAGGLFREAVAWAGGGVVDVPEGARIFSMSDLTPNTTIAARWAALEWAARPKIRIAAGTTRAKALAAFAAAGQSFTKLRPILAERIGAFLKGGDARSVNLTFVPDADLSRGQGTGPAIRFAWRQDFHPAWEAPLLILDATGQAEVLRHWAHDLEVVDIEVSVPNQYVLQIFDQEFGRNWLRQPGQVRALIDSILVELARADGAVLAIAQKGVEALLRAELAKRGAIRDPVPEGGHDDDASTWRFPSGAVLHLAHHGDITGSNTWSDVATVISIGRPAIDRLTGERLAEVIAGKAVAVVPDADNNWWPTTTAALRRADGTGCAIHRQPRHPDPLVEGCRWGVAEAGVLQGVGRGRGVRRTAANPLRVVILAALALPLTVNEHTPWEDYRPDRLTTAIAEAALFGWAMPLAAVDMATARPDLWPSIRTAERDLADFETATSLIEHIYKGNGGFKTLRPARYRTGLRGRWSRALVPREHGKTALEAAVGALSAYQEVCAPDPPEAPPDRADFSPTYRSGPRP